MSLSANIRPSEEATKVQQNDSKNGKQNHSKSIAAYCVS